MHVDTTKETSCASLLFSSAGSSFGLVVVPSLAVYPVILPLGQVALMAG
jgi:hypothetical protein